MDSNCMLCRAGVWWNFMFIAVGHNTEWL